jgi:hypothetical protein
MSFNRYLYVNNNPYKYTDPNGEFLDAIVDAALIAYDLGDMAINGINETNSASLGANVAGLLIPGATGLGLAVRAKKLGKVGCSFTPETMILTKDGYKTIIEVKVGDIVLSKNDQTGEVAWRTVTDTFKDWHTETITFTVVDENGVEESITTTAEHPFYVENQGWLPAGNVAEGTVISGPETDNNISIVKVQINQEPQYAYNFTVDTDHTYFVGKTNMWVHNACKKGKGDSSKNEKHGDSGRAMTKAEKQIEKLESQLGGANKKEKAKINKKIQNIKEDAQKKAKGEEHSRTKKR